MSANMFGASAKSETFVVSSPSHDEVFHVEIEQLPFLAFLVGPTNILAAWSDMLS